MAEYFNVEKPFLEKLRQLGWKVIDQGRGVPQEPVKSLRQSFKEVVLGETFKKAIRSINRTEDGREWLTDKQIEQVLHEVTAFSAQSLHQANKAIHHLLLKGTRTDRNELTGEPNPLVRLVDFRQWANNDFTAINQFRLLTPGAARTGIIPDIVLFLNGLPVVVIEAKDLEVAEPLSEAFLQITRYANTREDDYGIREGEERLFHYNIFSIITHGREARAGTISGEFEHFNNWVDIFPEEYKTVEYPPDEERQEVLICGMLNREILVDILKNFTLFMEVQKGVEIKTIARYNQYRAVGKAIRALREGETHLERGGVIWHTQGSGKSLTMVFLIKKIRSCDDLRDLKIIFVVDRVDLENQLSDTATLANEPVRTIESRSQLSALGDDTNDVNMVMIHKFLDDNKVSAQSLIDAGVVPTFKPFDVINRSERILILIDEAHRTQGGDMGDNLFTAFPAATRIGFTGTPLLTERHKVKTHERFGGFIDFYKFDQAIKDRATLEIKYIGKVSIDRIDDKETFDKEFEDMFRERTEAEREEIQRRYGSFLAYLESKERIRKIAKDILHHFYSDVMANGFKGQVVASSILAAVRYKYELEEAIKEKIAELHAQMETQAETASDTDTTLLRRLENLRVAAVVSSQGNNEPGFISQARREAASMNAIENFKKSYDPENPESNIGLLCVCDRLLTGFDAPIEQVMYLDKGLREHDLFQAIARVNRTRIGKNFGLIVDYYGVTKHLHEALAIYTDNDNKELNHFLESFRDINKEIPVLEARYKRLRDVFVEQGLVQADDFFYQRFSDTVAEFDFAEECIAAAQNIRFRAELLVYARSFFDSLDLLFNVTAVQEYWIPAKRLGYLLWRIQNRYKDETMDLKFASAKVRKLIDKHLESLGIDTKIAAVSLLSPEFAASIEQLNRSPRAKASEMEHAIRHHIKVNMDSDPTFYTHIKDRLEAALSAYRERWEELMQQLNIVRNDMAEGRKDEIEGISRIQAPFFGILRNAVTDPTEANIEETKNLLRLIFPYITETATLHNYWDKFSEVKRTQGAIEQELSLSRIPGLSERYAELSTELMKLAKSRRHDLR